MIYTIDAAQLCEAFTSAANTLINNKNILNDLNVFPVPDGDTGSNMSMTVSAAVAEITGRSFSSVGEAMNIIAGASLRGARGNSGVILSQLFRGMSKHLKGCEIADANDIAKAFREGVATAYRAVMKPVEGTMLSVSRDGADGGLSSISKDNEIVSLVKAVVKAAQKSLDKTPEILPQLKAAGVVDSGGQGIVYLLEGLLTYLETGTVVERKDGEAMPAPVSAGAKISDADIKFAYCTEFIIEKNNPSESSKPFAATIEKKGDSMVVVDDETIIKVHIHTNNPGYVIEEALKLGALINIKIDNMKYQHNSLTEEAPKTAEPQEPPKSYGFAAVAAGEGMEALFRDMGADEIILGGQTMNPSTDDILNAVNKINAETVFILPNNKNIIMAAEQVDSLTEKHICVIPTTSIPEGLSAMLAFSPDSATEDNAEAMKEAASFVKTGNVTFAVRDFDLNGETMPKGKIIGLTGKKITAAGDDPAQVAKDLLSGMVDEDSAVINVFYGEDVDDETAEGLQAYLEETYSACDVLVHSGKQPLYYYIVSVE
ncbi:MAG: DAK2 domain-containing protein [Ruminococcaceae bacterium]|nr:DAK2 domain-containing protein [Oscillospiraceae bacterium]